MKQIHLNPTKIIELIEIGFHHIVNPSFEEKKNAVGIQFFIQHSLNLMVCHIQANHRQHKSLSRFFFFFFEQQYLLTLRESGCA